MDFHGESRRQFRSSNGDTFREAFILLRQSVLFLFRFEAAIAVRWQSHDNQCRVVIGNPISLPNCAPNRFGVHAEFSSRTTHRTFSLPSAMLARSLARFATWVFTNANHRSVRSTFLYVHVRSRMQKFVAANRPSGAAKRHFLLRDDREEESLRCYIVLANFSP